MGRKGRSMRRVICALALLMSSAPAFAGDFDVLRGSESVGPARFTNWSGFYFGGQVGYSNVNTDFSKATSSLVAFSLRNTTLEQEQSPSSWPVLGQGNNSTTTFGGFIGYSTQWQDLILSIEGDYSRVNVTTTAAESPISRQTSAGGNNYDVTVLGSARLSHRLRLAAGACGLDFRQLLLCLTALLVLPSGAATTPARPWSTARRARERYPAIRARPRAASISLISTAMGIRR